MKRGNISCLILTGVLAAAAPAFVDATPEASDGTSGGIQQELADLNESLDELVVLLRAHVESQRFELMMQRMEVAQRRLAIKEQELASLREKKAARAAETKKLRENLAAVREDPVPMGIADDQVDSVAAEWEHHVEVLTDQVWSLEQREIDLDKQATRLREDLQAWEKAIDEALR